MSATEKAAWRAAGIHLLTTAGMVAICCRIRSAEFSFQGYAAVFAGLLVLCLVPLWYLAAEVAHPVQSGWWPGILLSCARACLAALAVNVVCSRGELDSYRWVAALFPAAAASKVLFSVIARLET